MLNFYQNNQSPGVETKNEIILRRLINGTLVIFADRLSDSFQCGSIEFDSLILFGTIHSSDPYDSMVFDIIETLVSNI